MRTYYWLSQLFLRLVLWAGFGLKVRGRENIPRKGGVIIAANHISLADPPFIGAVCRREPYYLAKEELFHHKALAALIRAYHAYPLRRGKVSSQAITWAIGLLRSGHALLLFPEGRRQKGGRLGRGRPGVGLIATRSGAPVIPCLIQDSNHLRQAFLRKRRLLISFGLPFRAGITDYQLFAQKVMERIGKLRGSYESPPRISLQGSENRKSGEN